MTTPTSSPTRTLSQNPTFPQVPKVPKASIRVLSPLIAVLAWQLLSVLGLIPERILPAPTTILAAAVTLE